MSLLSVRDLSVGYGPVRALAGVNLELAEGAITAVLGANGAGKTTLLRTVNGLLRPSSGSVRLAGREITTLPVEDVVRHGVAHVPEGRGVITELTVAENLRLGGLWRRDPADLRVAMREVYQLFEPLALSRDRPAGTLSGGERQMLALGRALVSRPRLLMLDEPSLGLASRITTELMTVVRRLRAELGMTVLLVEQNARSALSIADQAVVLNVGRVVADQPAAVLAADDTLRHSYLGF
ncbi:MAG TPA: ABC transporter ATP-binding protein [Kineosporiaceae bacterium]|nr:ABC transporter ATP-binding protein [Kineosporiaceae bacterium]